MRLNWRKSRTIMYLIIATKGPVTRKALQYLRTEGGEREHTIGLACCWSEVVGVKFSLKSGATHAMKKNRLDQRSGAAIMSRTSSTCVGWFQWAPFVSGIAALIRPQATSSPFEITWFGSRGL